jgi:thiamine biosynthesis lipoprotein
VLVTHPADLQWAGQLIRAETAAVDAVANRLRPDSEINRLPARAGVAQEISPLLADLVAVALDAARATDGDVDPTRADPTRADPTRADPAGRRAGWRSVGLHGNRLLLPAGVQLDLTAIAPAVTADRCAAAVHTATGGGVLVAVGGDLATAGPAPAGGWRLAVDDETSAVLPAHRRLHASLVLAGGIAVATRGAAAGPVPGWRSVSVAAATARAAAVWASAAVARGRIAPLWLAGLGAPARLVAPSGRVVTVGGWPG